MVDQKYLRGKRIDSIDRIAEILIKNFSHPVILNVLADYRQIQIGIDIHQAFSHQVRLGSSFSAAKCKKLTVAVCLAWIVSPSTIVIFPTPALQIISAAQAPTPPSPTTKTLEVLAFQARLILAAILSAKANLTQ